MSVVRACARVGVNASVNVHAIERVYLRVPRACARPITYCFVLERCSIFDQQTNRGLKASIGCHVQGWPLCIPCDGERMCVHVRAHVRVILVYSAQDTCGDILHTL